jgi:orotidine-5'-phosphate decarboxylase
MKNPPEICIALDGMSMVDAMRMADRLSGRVWGFKVGDLLTEHGSSFFKLLSARGKIFADLKFFDIPSTVHNHCRRLAHAGADILTIHATGGMDMMEQAMKAVAGTPCQVAAVTILTSFTQDDIWYTFRERTRYTAVLKLRSWALQVQVPALVCSAEDVDDIVGFYTIVPGIRPINWQVPNDDQYVKARFLPKADLLVVGRPITQAEDPDRALTELTRQLYGEGH